jgi:hypothetical protein
MKLKLKIVGVQSRNHCSGMFWMMNSMTKSWTLHLRLWGRKIFFFGRQTTNYQTGF